MKKLTAADPETKSADLVAENVALLGELFPEAMTEGKIDFEVLRQLLGGAVEEREEKYGLSWHGKRRARQIALTPSTGTLLPCPEESVDWESTQNLMIEGDNLEVLKLLQKSYAGEVKLIYIDPPYNNGNDRIYPDNFADSISNYMQITGQSDGQGLKISSNSESSGRFHTDWLNMIYPRLKLARNFLSPDGVILISIDENEYQNVRHVCCDIFGEENSIGTIIWKGATDNNPTQIAVEHEYVLCFARDKNSIKSVWKNFSDSSKQLILGEYDRLVKESDEPSWIQDRLRSFIRTNRESLSSVTHYDRVDELGVYTGSRKVHNPKPGGYKFDVIHPVTKRVCVPPVNGYRFPPDRMAELVNSGKILYGEDETQIIQIKEYLKDYEGKLSSVVALDSRTGSNELNDIFGRQKVFSNPKPTAFLRSLFEFIVSSGDIVLDFYAGSGSTADAIWQLNSADRGRRRTILVQLPEPLVASDKDQKVASEMCDELNKPRNIAEITKERLRRAGVQRTTAQGGHEVDNGFRVYKLSTSNISTWDPDRDDLTGTLDRYIDNIKEGRSEQDLLTELLLKLGLDLAVPIQQKVHAGKTVHSIGAGTLIACLAPKITRTEIEALAQGIIDWRNADAPAGETTIVFRDSAFEDDVAKSNLTAILQQHGLENVRSL